MNSEQIKRKLIAVCAKVFQDFSIDSDMFEYVDFADDLGMDSLTFITLVVEMEAYFDIIVPDDLLLIDNFRNMNNVIQIISDQLATKALEEGDVLDDQT